MAPLGWADPATSPRTASVAIRMKREGLLLFAAVVLLTAARLWLASQWTVTPDEALSWLCSRRMDLAFFDAPWGVAWLIRWGAALAGDGSYGMRLFFPIAAGVATVAAWAFARQLAGPAAGWWAAALLNATPGFQMAAVEAGAQAPALAASLIGLAVIASAPTATMAWIMGGVAFAVAVQFSLWPLVSALAALGFLVPLHKEKAASLVWVQLVCYLGLVGIGMLPYVIWNQANNWPVAALGTWQTFTQMSVGATLGSLNQAIRVISGPALLALAVGMALLIVSWRRERRLRRLGVILGPLLIAWLFGAVTGQAGTFLILLSFVFLVAGISATLAPWWRIGLGATLALLISIQFYLQATLRLPDLPWSSVRRSLEALIESGTPYQASPLFLIAQSPRLTASLNYHIAQSDIAQEVEVFLLESQNLANQFGIWPSYDDFIETETAPDELFEELRAANPYVGRSAFYVTREPMTALPQSITAAFEEIQPAATIGLAEGGMLYIYFCRNYQTLPL